MLIVNSGKNADQNEDYAGNTNSQTHFFAVFGVCGKHGVKNMQQTAYDPGGTVESPMVKES